MSTSGADEDQLVEVRSALLDALTALADHRDSVIVIGAQAIYLHTGRADVALAEATKDSDLAVDSRSLGHDPRIETAMESARFCHDPSGQPGAWLSPRGVPVDLMVPEALAGTRGRRGVDLPPHDKRAMRRAVGLEAAVVDNNEMTIQSLGADDWRRVTARVAGPAALLVAKMHKIGERELDPKRLVDKDAHDVYRLLVAIDTSTFVAAFRLLLDDDLAGEVRHGACPICKRCLQQDPTRWGAAWPPAQRKGSATRRQWRRHAPSWLPTFSPPLMPSTRAGQTSVTEVSGVSVEAGDYAPHLQVSGAWRESTLGN